MALAAVTDKIDDHVIVESEAVVKRELGNENDSIGIVPVNVKIGAWMSFATNASRSGSEEFMIV